MVLLSDQAFLGNLVSSGGGSLEAQKEDETGTQNSGGNYVHSFILA
jgi:hypothetical protein